MFTSNHSFWLDLDGNTSLIRDDSGLRRETYRPRQSRLEREGWVLKKGGANHLVFEKAIREGWILRRLGWGGSFELEQPDECKLAFPTWEWAEWDRHRLVWAEGGRICAATLGVHKLDSVHTVYDFNGNGPRLQDKLLE